MEQSRTLTGGGSGQGQFLVVDLVLAVVGGLAWFAFGLVRPQTPVDRENPSRARITIGLTTALVASVTIAVFLVRSGRVGSVEASRIWSAGARRPWLGLGAAKGDHMTVHYPPASLDVEPSRTGLILSSLLVRPVSRCATSVGTDVEHCVHNAAQVVGVLAAALPRRVEHRFSSAHGSSVRSLGYDMPGTVTRLTTAIGTQPVRLELRLEQER